MDPKKEEARLNAWIMDTALRGKSDYELCPLMIDWQRQGRFLIAYISDLENDICWYRVFRYTSGAFYERERVINPTYKGSNYICLYNSVEKKNVRTQLHCAEGAWCNDLIMTFEEPTE